MAKSNSNKTHKKNQNTQHQKWFLGTAAVLIALLVLSTGAVNLTGHVVQTSCAECDNLTLQIVNLDSIQINGNVTAHSFTALRLTSDRNDAFLFGSEQKSTIWVLLKNRSAAGANTYIGKVLYLNSSSVYTLVSTSEAGETTYAGRNLIFTLPSYRHYTSALTQPQVVFYTRETTSTRASNVIRNGGATVVRVEVPEVISYNSSSIPSYGKWVSYIVFGAGSAFGNPRATDAAFRNAPGSTATTKISYEYNDYAPYCSTRGSCVETSPTRSSVVIKYATVLP